ncbi:hypothetical protein V8F06_003102 [Rhypophila decipiens]
MATNPELPFLNTGAVPEILFPMPDSTANFPPWLAKAHAEAIQAAMNRLIDKEDEEYEEYGDDEEDKEGDKEDEEDWVPTDIPSYLRVFLNQTFWERMRKAKHLNVDLRTALTQSATTHLPVIHGLTDEQMDSEIDTHGDRIGLRDLVMWKQFQDGVDKDPATRKTPGVIISDLKRLASRILGPKYDWPIQLDIKRVVEKVHIRFIATAYPIDAVLYVLEHMSENRHHEDASLLTLISGGFIQSLEGSGEGRVTIQMVRDALASMVPPGRGTIEWMNTTVSPIITPLEGKFPVSLARQLLHGLRALRSELLAYNAPSVIFEYLDHRSRGEEIDHWVRILDYAYEQFGRYRLRRRCAYLDHRPLGAAVTLRLEQNKKFLAKPSAVNSNADFESDKGQDSGPPANTAHD